MNQYSADPTNLVYGIWKVHDCDGLTRHKMTRMVWVPQFVKICDWEMNGRWQLRTTWQTARVLFGIELW